MGSKVRCWCCGSRPGWDCDARARDSVIRSGERRSRGGGDLLLSCPQPLLFVFCAHSGDVLEGHVDPGGGSITCWLLSPSEECPCMMHKNPSFVDQHVLSGAKIQLVRTTPSATFERSIARDPAPPERGRSEYAFQRVCFRLDDVFLHRTPTVRQQEGSY